MLVEQSVRLWAASGNVSLSEIDLAFSRSRMDVVHCRANLLKSATLRTI